MHSLRMLGNFADFLEFLDRYFCVPQNSYVEVFTPTAQKCDCIWRQGL